MDSNVDVPYTRRNVSVLSQRSNFSGRQRTPQPINESMVRERLSANLPDSFHYLSNTLPMGRRSHHHHRHRQNSISSNSDSSSSDGEEPNDNDAGQRNPPQRTRRASTLTAAVRRVSALATSGDPEGRSLRHQAHQHPSSRTNSRSSSRNSRHSSTSSTDTSESEREKKDDEDDYAFFSRLVKLDKSALRDCDHTHSPSSLAAAAAASSSTAGAPLVAQCRDTVRETIDLIDKVRLSPHEGVHHDTFFWLDLHGVPPPLPGSPAWGSRPRRWQKTQQAALRRAVQDAEPNGSGRLPEVELSVLWQALGLQAAASRSLDEVCVLRQRAPRPDRTSLDDIYEEEMADLAYPDDRILHIDLLSTAAPSTGEGHSNTPAEPPVYRPSREEPCSPEGSSVVEGQPITPQTSFNTAANGPAAAGGAWASTHYVVMEMATLLTSVPATTTAMSVGTWTSALLSHVGPHDYANEPLNGLVWAETLGRSVHAFPADYRTVAAAQRKGMAGRGGSGASRQMTLSSVYQPELPATPLITSTYVICFPGGCVTWCPGSTLGLVSAARRERRAAAAQERRRRRRTHGRSSHPLPTQTDTPETARRPRVGDQAGSNDASSTSTSSEDSDVDAGLAVQYVKSWEQLQAAVFHRLRYMATFTSSNSVNNNAMAAGDDGAPALCTSGFVSLLLSAVCYAYLPNTTSVLSEVDAIDSMLPLMGLNVESDQADALRRVLLLRRRLAVHRRLLFQKIRLLEALDRPAMHTIARFVRTVKVPSWVGRGTLRGGSLWGSLRGPGTRSSEEAQGRESDTDSLSTAPSPHLPDHTSRTAAHFMASGQPKQPIVHFLDTTEEPPLSQTTAEQNYGGEAANGNTSSKSVSKSCFPGVEKECGPGSQGVTFAGRPAPRMTEPPSLNAIHKGIANILRSLEVARTVLGNTTLIYCSTVNYNNSRSSEGTDYFALMCQYTLLVVMPFNMVASQWGLNCAVPFGSVTSTTPFWVIVGIMIALGIAGLGVPIYAYRTGQINMIS